MKKLATIIAAGGLCACSSVPDVEYSYYPAKSTSLVSVTQTIDCNADKTSLIVVSTPAVTTAYSSDLAKSPYTIRIKAIEGFWGGLADSDMNFGFFDDGRLKSVNQNTTGQGEAFIKSAVSLAGAVAALGAGGPSDQPKVALPECGVIASWGAGKPVSLIYSAPIDFSTARGTAALTPAPGTIALYNALKGKLPVLDVAYVKTAAVGSRAHYLGSPSDDIVPLKLQQTVVVKADIRANGQIIGTANVTVPGADTYILPIPRAALFGRQAFTLTLSEAGAIIAIDYGKNTGAAGSANAAKAIADAFAPDTTAQKVADIRSQADLIAQQQRLARCQAQPEKCQ